MKKILVLFSLLLCAVSLRAQDAFERFQFEPNLNYNAEITSPADFLGYELGEEFTFHHQIMDYFKQLDEESDRLSFHKYATTYEGRDLYYAVISSEQNQGNIESIREANVALTNHPKNKKWMTTR